MKMNDLIKIFKENKDLLFNEDAYIMLKCISGSRIAEEDKLTKEQKEFIIKIFMYLKCGFNKNTPNFILVNKDCVRLAVVNNINSVKYLDEDILDKELKDEIIMKVIRQKFVITNECPNFLRENFCVARNSIILDVKSADYIDWLVFNDKECEELINLLIQNKYILHAKSNIYLKNNVDIILNSIKDNINNICYAGEYAIDEPVIFKYLLLHGYEFSKDEILFKKLNYFKEPEVLKEALKRINIYTSNDKKYCDRLFEIFKDVINSEIKIKEFDEVFKYNSEELWNIEKVENTGIYNNVFAKICAELRNLREFDEVFYKLDFLEQMKVVLKEQFQELLLAMQEYYKIYHGNVDNKLEKLESSKNIIARLSALYVSKCKDNFINDWIEVMREFLYPYFDLNLNEPEIYKKLILSKQIKIFRMEYQNKNSSVWKNVQAIVNNYKNTDDYLLVKKLVDYFILYNSRDVSKVISMPKDYKKYCRYRDAIKLVNRLNSGYIKYDDVEVIRYHDIIKFDVQEKKYIYYGCIFSDEDFDEYERSIKLYNYLKKQIMLMIKEIKLDEELDDDLVSNLADEMDFNDRYFEYSQDRTLESISLRELVNVFRIKDIIPKVLLNDKQYKVIYDLLVNKRIMWCFLMDKTMFYCNGENLVLDSENTVKIINRIDLLMDLSEKFNFDLNKFKDLCTVFEISNYADERDLAILGNDIIKKLAKNLSFTSENVEYIISASSDLICQMVLRNKSTVPYVTGKYLNYCYSLYTPQDNSILTSGIDTDACFRVDGVDNNFFHYCALDKNGFVIKITDEFGNFMARAAGFRNGNCVYINQLRTIYDRRGNEYLNDYNNETTDIIKTFELACKDILNTSQKNCFEGNKIEHVFVTKSYCLDNCDVNVTDEIIDEIGCDPEENCSDDWNLFVKNTKNLDTFNGLGTDYGSYAIICVASVKNPFDLIPDDIKHGDVPAVYNYQRRPIKVVMDYDEEIIRELNKIKAIAMMKDYKMVEVPDDSVIIMGDNWYIIYRNKQILDCCILDKDTYALKEAKMVMEVISEMNLDKTINSYDIKVKFDSCLKKKLKQKNPN